MTTKKGIRIIRHLLPDLNAHLRTNLYGERIRVGDLTFTYEELKLKQDKAMLGLEALAFGERSDASGWSDFINARPYEGIERWRRSTVSTQST